MYIGYEKVFEGRTYLGELRGAAKKKESIFDLVKVFGALRQRFGRSGSTSASPSRCKASSMPAVRAGATNPSTKT